MTETGITVTLRTTPDRLRAAKRELETAWAGGDDQGAQLSAFISDLDRADVSGEVVRLCPVTVLPSPCPGPLYTTNHVCRYGAGHVGPHGCQQCGLEY